MFEDILWFSFVALIAFFLWGVGYLIVQDMRQTDIMNERCIAADKQWVLGNCVN